MSQAPAYDAVTRPQEERLDRPENPTRGPHVAGGVDTANGNEKAVEFVM